MWYTPSAVQAMEVSRAAGHRADGESNFLGALCRKSLVAALLSVFSMAGPPAVELLSLCSSPFSSSPYADGVEKRDVITHGAFRSIPNANIAALVVAMCTVVTFKCYVCTCGIVPKYAGTVLADNIMGVGITTLVYYTQYGPAGSRIAFHPVLEVLELLLTSCGTVAQVADVA